MSRLSPSSVAGSAAAVLVALATAAAFAQTASMEMKSDPKALQPAKQAAPTMKPLTPQGPLAAKPTPSTMSPGSQNLATRPLPATTSPPPAASTKPPAAPPPGGAKKCGERKGDC